jgi:hypothetical protein
MIKQSEKEINDLKKIIESLSPNEIKILPYLKEGSFKKLHEKTDMNKTAIVRSLEFLSNHIFYFIFS